MTDYRINDGILIRDNEDGTITLVEHLSPQLIGQTIAWDESPLSMAEVQEMASTYSAEVVAKLDSEQKVVDAGNLLTSMLIHAQIPIQSRSSVEGAQLDIQAGNLLASTLSSTDPRIIGYTAKITAIALRLTRERDEYESGLAP